MVLCKNCKEETKNPKYCSKRCSAVGSNKEFPKRKKTKKCKECETLTLSNRTYCKECFYKFMSVENKTIKELKKNGNANGYGYPMIRQDSRRKYLRSNKPIECFICKYNLHVDICHIKDVKDFDEDTLIKEVNKIENLIALCKNHHWEFDNRTLIYLSLLLYPLS